MKLYYYGARYYNANLGRFISPDPVREYINLYSYCLNDPINLIDRDGKIAWWVAALIGIAGEAVVIATTGKSIEEWLAEGLKEAYDYGLPDVPGTPGPPLTNPPMPNSHPGGGQ